MKARPHFAWWVWRDYRTRVFARRGGVRGQAVSQRSGKRAGFARPQDGAGADKPRQACWKRGAASARKGPRGTFNMTDQLLHRTNVQVADRDGLPLTIPALLRARVESRGASVLLACDDDILTYEAAERDRPRSPGVSLAAGAGKGTHVGILHPNGSEFVVAWLAAARIGAVSVPLSTFSTSAELRVLLRNADVALLLSASIVPIARLRSRCCAKPFPETRLWRRAAVARRLAAGPAARRLRRAGRGRPSGLVHAMDRGARAVDRAKRPRGGGGGGQRR